MVILDDRAILASAQAVWVVLGDLRHWWVLMLDFRVIIASA